jgi:transcriptional regulator with XRE-family HTH domain
MTPNERLALARKTLNLTQKEFAEKISVANGYIASMEIGNRKVNPRIMKLVSSIFGVSLYWLETGEGEMFSKDPLEETEEIINLYKRLDPFFKKFILRQLRELIEFKNSADRR